MVFGLNLFPTNGLMVNASFQMNDNFYAGFAPSERVVDTSIEDDTEDDNFGNPRMPIPVQDAISSGKDVVKLPSYSLMDVHLSYNMNLMGYNLTLGAHVLNALDTEYITYAEDQGFEDVGSNSLPKVYFGSGTQMRMSFKIDL